MLNSMLYSMLYHTLSPPQYTFENVLYSMVYSLLYSIWWVYRAVTGVTASHAAERQSMAEWWQSSARLTCKAEKLSLRASLFPKALPWMASLWDKFFTFWGWACLSCLVAPWRGPIPRPKSALVPGPRELNPVPLWCGVGEWGAPNSAVKVAARSSNYICYIAHINVI